MKKLISFGALTLFVSAHAWADCKSAALWAAKNTYGNAPYRTRIHQLTKNTWEVTVGIGNAEDGAHVYQVTFEGPTCDPNAAIVCDMTMPADNDPRLCHQ